jgi:rhodanese-related sulfurtransferase
MQQLIEFVSNHALLSGAWVAILIMLIYGMVTSLTSPVKELTTHDATMLINKQDAVVVDIRQSAEFNKGHILGATLIKQEQLTKADFSKVEKNKDKPIIVVCAMGMNSRRVTTQMLKAGFSQVHALKGGMGAWTSAGLPVKK